MATTLDALLALVPTNNLRQINAVSLQTLLTDLLDSGVAGFLHNDGANNLSWEDAGGSGGEPGGDPGQLQFNDTGAFGGDTSTTDGAGNVSFTSWGVGGVSPTGVAFCDSGGFIACDHLQAVEGIVCAHGNINLDGAGNASVLAVVCTGTGIFGNLSSDGGLVTSDGAGNVGCVTITVTGLGTFGSISSDGGGVTSDGAGNLRADTLSSDDGFSGTGAFTTFTFRDGICTAAS